MSASSRTVWRALFLAAIVAWPGSARASLISLNEVFDTPTFFQGTVDVPTFSVDSVTFSSTNWLVTVREDFIGSEVIPNDFEITAQHLVATGLNEAAPNPFSLSIIFFANAFTPGGPPSGEITTSVIHAPDALDLLRVSYDPVIAGQTSRITITADHETAVPEPGTIGLVGAGLIAAWRGRRQKRR